MGCAAFLLYLALLQRTFYGDVVGTLIQIDDGRAWQSTTHCLHAPVVQGVAAALAPLGVSLFWAGCVVSALGTAVGVGFYYAASRQLGASRASATGVAGLVALCPAVLCFATVFEVHGLFFAFSGLAALCFARQVARPGWHRAVHLGLGTGLAFFAHATANLLPWFFGLAMVLMLRQRGARLGRLAGLAVLTLLVHNLLVFGGAWLLRQLGWSAVDPAAAAQSVRDHLVWLDRGWWDLLHAAFSEWFRPYFPICAVALAGLVFGRERGLAVALHLALIPFTVLAFFLVRFGDEFGAYALPLAWPAAVVASRLLTCRWVGVVLVASAVLSVAVVVDRDVDARTGAGRERARAVRTLAGDRPLLLLIAARADVALRFVDLPEVEYVFLPTLAIREAAEVRAWFPLLAQRLRGHLARGGCIYLPRDSQALLVDPAMQARSSGTAALVAGLQQGFTWRATDHGAFVGVELR